MIEERDSILKMMGHLSHHVVPNRWMIPYNRWVSPNIAAFVGLEAKRAVTLTYDCYRTNSSMKSYESEVLITSS